MSSCLDVFFTVSEEGYSACSRGNVGKLRSKDFKYFGGICMPLLQTCWSPLLVVSVVTLKGGMGLRDMSLAND